MESGARVSPAGRLIAPGDILVNLQCLIYGTDPVKYAEIVTAGDLTPARAKACPRETRQVGRAWLRLLLPHLAPKYEMTEAEAIRYFERPQ
jgi:hypothetical protein